MAEVLRSGKQYVGPADDFDSKDGHIISVTPVTGVPGGRHALVVRQKKEILGSRLTDIRKLLLLLGLGGAAAGHPGVLLLRRPFAGPAAPRRGPARHPRRPHRPAQPPRLPG